MVMNLAYRLRPQNLDEFVGQDHLVGKGKIIRQMIESDTLFSMILWGPPGSGKTTLAYIVSKETNADFHHLSAVATGKDALFKVIGIAKENQQIDKKTILFIDEIHRWNKAQQDALLPYVESGLIIVIGATTENPSFEVISALLSRCRVFVLKSLEPDDLSKIIDRAIFVIASETKPASPKLPPRLASSEAGQRGEQFQRSPRSPSAKLAMTVQPEAEDLLIRLSGGDARIMLNALEMAIINYRQKNITPEIVKEVFQTKSAGLYDKKADEHYNIISAFIKSMRGSDVDASLYYLARMLENGEDPKFIARRMIIFASEDIGLADRGALIQANAGFEAVHKIGMPEAQLILAHICVYLARAAKSRATTNALTKAKQAVYDYPNEPVPLHLRNAPTKLMKSLGYAKDYTWSEKYVGPKEKLSFLPEKLKDRKFYEP